MGIMVGVLLYEGRTIQDNLKTCEFTTAISRVSKQFHDLFQKGDISGSLRLLTNNISNGILPLNAETHPEGNLAVETGTIINGPLERIHVIAFNEINEDIVLKAAKNPYFITIWHSYYRSEKDFCECNKTDVY